MPADPGVLALVAAPAQQRIFSLEGDTLVARTPEGRQTASRPCRTGAAGATIVVDQTVDVLWVVPLDGPTPGRARAYSTDDLQPLRQEALPGVATDATVVDGTLWVATGSQLYALPAGDGGFAPPLDVAALSLTADPGRHRLLYVTGRVDRYLVRSRAAAGVGRDVESVLPTIGPPPTLAVVDGVIWTAGSGASGAVLARLDPTTLRAGRDRAGRNFGSASMIVTTGDRSLLLRDGGLAGRLWCADAGSGRLLRVWSDRPGTLAVTGGRAFASVLDGPLQAVPLGRCTG